MVPGAHPEGQFYVDIPERVDLRVQVASENPQPLHVERLIGVGVVFAGTLQQPGDQLYGRLPSDWLPKAGHGQGISEGCRLPPNAPVIADFSPDQIAGFFHAREGAMGVLDTAPAEQAVGDILGERAAAEQPG